VSVSAKDAYFSVGFVLTPGLGIVESDLKPGTSLKGKISGVADTGNTSPTWRPNAAYRGASNKNPATSNQQKEPVTSNPPTLKFQRAKLVAASDYRLLTPDT
jgi:hypothetical protein